MISNSYNEKWLTHNKPHMLEVYFWPMKDYHQNQDNDISINLKAFLCHFIIFSSLLHLSAPAMSQGNSWFHSVIMGYFPLKKWYYIMHTLFFLSAFSHFSELFGNWSMFCHISKVHFFNWYISIVLYGYNKFVSPFGGNLGYVQ